MRYGLVTLAAAAAFGMSLAAASADGTPAAPTGATPASVDAASSSTGDPNKIVCKSFDAPTGTRLGAKRVCQTEAAWEEQERQNRLDVQHEQNRGALFQMPSG